MKVLLDQFKSMIKGSLDLSSSANSNLTNGQLVAKVADVIWSFLAPSSTNSSSSNLSVSKDLKGSQSSSGDTLGSSGSTGGIHLQFVSSLLLDRRLDSFGLTFCVICSLQLLYPKHFMKSFFLTLSEDHSWISVRDESNLDNNSHGTSDGNNNNNDLKRVEVTWHGKTDKRRENHFKDGKFIDPEKKGNWLYLNSFKQQNLYHNYQKVSNNGNNSNNNNNGSPIICCDYKMIISALISSINPAISISTDSLPLVLVQKSLLSILYSKGWLNKYPMAIGTLADLMELLHLNNDSSKSNDNIMMSSIDTSNIEMTNRIKSSIGSIYSSAITSSITYYSNSHIYPYLYLAGFYFRMREFSAALNAWSAAARVISKYNFVPKEDEEAYKEFQEISNDLIPFSLKSLMTGDGIFISSNGSDDSHRVPPFPLLTGGQDDDISMDDDDLWSSDEESDDDEDDDDHSGSDAKIQTSSAATAPTNNHLTPQNYKDLIEFYDGLCGWEEGSRWPIMHIGWAKSLISSLNKFHPLILTQVRVVSIGELRERRQNKRQKVSGDQKSEDGDDVTKVDTDEKQKDVEPSASISPSLNIQELISKCSSDPEFLLKDQITDAEEGDVPMGDKKESGAGDKDTTGGKMDKTVEAKVVETRESLDEETPDGNKKRKRTRHTSSGSKRQKPLIIILHSIKMSEMKNLLYFKPSAVGSSHHHHHHSSSTSVGSGKPSSHSTHHSSGSHMSSLKLNTSAIQLQLTAQSSILTSGSSALESVGSTGQSSSHSHNTRGLRVSSSIQRHAFSPIPERRKRSGSTGVKTSNGGAASGGKHPSADTETTKSSSNSRK